MQQNYWAQAAENVRAATPPDEQTARRWEASARQFDQWAEEGRTVTGDLP